VRLGDGSTAMMSPDGQLVAAIDPSNAAITVVPVGTGRPRHFVLKGFVINRVHWSRDAKQLYFSAPSSGHASRIYRLSLDGGTPQPLSPDGVNLTPTGVSPDGRYLPGTEVSSLRILFYPTAGGAGEVMPGILPDERIANWAEDSTAVYAYQIGEDNPFPLKVFRVDLKTGKRQLQKIIAPGDEAGIAVGAVRFTPDGKTYAYTADQGLAVLHVVDGLK